VRVLDAAVEKASGGAKKIAWMEVFAGETAKNKFDNWLARRHRRSVQGIPCRHQRPADHAGRRRHPLAQCRAAANARSLRLPPAGAVFHRRPIAREASGKSGHGHFRENTEDIYAGIEYAGGTPEAQKVLDFLAREFPKSFDKIRFGTEDKAEQFWKTVGATGFPCDVKVGIGIKPVSYSGSVRLITARSATRSSSSARA
jgi:isocitrate dehydrogenase